MEETTKGKTILIVEDEKLLSEMYEKIFEQEGFYVKVANTGKEALAEAKRSKPDFILLDILLPEENGIFFLEQRAKDPELVDIPVVAFSNFDDTPTKAQTRKLGVKDYLIKTNYTPQEVVQKVQTYIQ